MLVITNALFRPNTTKATQPAETYIIIKGSPAHLHLVQCAVISVAQLWHREEQEAMPTCLTGTWSDSQRGSLGAENTLRCKQCAWAGHKTNISSVLSENMMSLKHPEGLKKLKC